MLFYMEAETLKTDASSSCFNIMRLNTLITAREVTGFTNQLPSLIVVLGFMVHISGTTLGQFVRGSLEIVRNWHGKGVGGASAFISHLSGAFTVYTGEQ